MTLRRVDLRVEGTYCFGTLTGTIIYPGPSAITILEGAWSGRGSAGNFRFALRGYDGAIFQGTWDDVNEWCGWRPSGTPPNPCPPS